MMEHNGQMKTAFELKREGTFDEALRLYVQDYAIAVAQKDPYITRLCFEQLFDILLMIYLRDRKVFGSVDEIMRQIEQDLTPLLMDAGAYREEDMRRLLATSREKFAPGGRRKGKFNVDKDWLIAKKTPKAARKAG